MSELVVSRSDTLPVTTHFVFELADLGKVAILAQVHMPSHLPHVMSWSEQPHETRSAQPPSLASSVAV